MRTARGTSKIFFTLAVFLALLAFGAPEKAWAATAYTCGTDNSNTTDTFLQSKFAASAQEIVQAKQAIIVAYGAKTIGACWSKIQNLFSMVGGMNGFVGAIFNVIMQQIMAVVNQACQVALNLTNQITQYAQRELASLTCIPLPKLGLGLSNINLGLGMPPACNGVSVLGGPSMAPRVGYLWQSLLPQSQGGGLSGGNGWSMP